jgi:hypothetical protein
MSPVFRMLSADDEKHLKGRTLTESKLLMNIVVEAFKRCSSIVPHIQIKADGSLIFSAKQA